MPINYHKINTIEELEEKIDETLLSRSKKGELNDRLHLKILLDQLNTFSHAMNRIKYVKFKEYLNYRIRYTPDEIKGSRLSGRLKTIAKSREELEFYFSYLYKEKNQNNEVFLAPGEVSQFITNCFDVPEQDITFKRFTLNLKKGDKERIYHYMYQVWNLLSKDQPKIVLAKILRSHFTNFDKGSLEVLVTNIQKGPNKDNLERRINVSKFKY